MADPNTPEDTQRMTREQIARAMAEADGHVVVDDDVASSPYDRPAAPIRPSHIALRGRG